MPSETLYFTDEEWYDLERLSHKLKQPHKVVVILALNKYTLDMLKQSDEYAEKGNTSEREKGNHDHKTEVPY